MLSEALAVRFSVFHAQKEAQIAAFKKRIEEIEAEKKEYRKNAIKYGYTREEIEETSEEFDKSIRSFQERLLEFDSWDESEVFLERLPEILWKTFELTSEALYKAKTKGMTEDVLTLLEKTTFELTVNNKKELRIKLFDVLDELVSEWDFNLEAPSGVEPLSTALQAAV